MSDTLTPRLGRIALILAAILAIAAIGIKLWQERTPDAGPEIAGNTTQAPDVGAMITQLETRLKTNPNDVEGWRMLAWSFFQTQRFAEAATAYRRATALRPDDGNLWSSLGEALVMAGPGTSFPPDARTAFARALQIDPKDPRARYFFGVAKDMAGDHKGALDDWFALLRDTPASAPWEPSVRQTIQQVAAKQKIDVSARLAALRPAAPASGTATATVSGPTREQMQAAQAMPPGQQQAMVRGMVDGLAARLNSDPQNVEGWIMLMRSYQALGRANDARAALREAMAANPGAKARLEDAARDLGL